jgi:hypothetical protein
VVVAINTAYARPQGDTTRTNMLTNGTFTGAATGWTLGPNWTYGSNQVACSGGVGGSNVSQSGLSFANGASYRTAFTISGYSASSIRIWIYGGTAVLGTLRSSNGTFLQTLTENNPTTNTQFMPALASPPASMTFTPSR